MSLMCSSGEGITIHPELLCDAVCLLCVPVVRISQFIQNFSVMLCVSLMCSSGEDITIHPELLSDDVCCRCLLHTGLPGAVFSNGGWPHASAL